MRFAPIQQPGTLTSVWLLALELKRTKHFHAIVVFVFAPVGNLPHVQLGVGHAGQQAVKVLIVICEKRCSASFGCCCWVLLLATVVLFESHKLAYWVHELPSLALVIVGG